MRLKNKVAIITGAAQGIGAAYALGLAKQGAKIVVADILDGLETVHAVKDLGSDAIFVSTDITSQQACDCMAKAAFDKFGSVDILINNAALFGGIVLRPFTELTSEEWNQMMLVNAGGPFHCCKAVFPYMKAQMAGKIINMSSESILHGVPGMLHYVASKGAVMALTRGLAREVGDFNINVNTIAPGFTHSPGGDNFDKNKQLIDIPLEDILMAQKCLKRESVPEDLVGLAVFLASNESDFITGQMINHDGGICLY